MQESKHILCYPFFTQVVAATKEAIYCWQFKNPKKLATLEMANKRKAGSERSVSLPLHLISESKLPIIIGRSDIPRSQIISRFCFRQSAGDRPSVVRQSTVKK